MTIWVATNGRPSNGAKTLAAQPGFKRLRTGKGVKPKDLVINWGSSQPLIDLFKPHKIVLNRPTSVKTSACKLSTFQQLVASHVSHVEWTDCRVEAQIWSDKGTTVVVRQKLTGHSGDGIIIVEKCAEVPDAPLYTKYIFKDKEFRVHVVGDKVIDTQQKIKDPNKEVVTWKVRSHANGFIYARNNVHPDHVRDALAIAATGALGLHFGAVDIIQDKAGAYYVLEINTAPGLEGQTVERYAQAFRNWGVEHAV